MSRRTVLLAAIAATTLTLGVATASRAQVTSPGATGGSSATLSRGDSRDPEPTVAATFERQLRSGSVPSGVVFGRRNLALLRSYPALALLWRRNGPMF